ncbi:helix-turn-helix transcriptional regulator [Eubacteriales bacterium OttesenSCG-928-G02]|nr:helix-turn-helix transcriptional regulator [Eubacteriales bacterium OttesenSCG-928-G02]
MAISYKRLWKQLIDKEMSKKQLEIKAHLSSSTIAKMNKSQGVTTTTLERICRVLDCKIEDVVEIVPDEEGAKNEP